MEELNKIETKRAIHQINESKGWFFEKINKINFPVAQLIKKRKEKIRINSIRDKKEI